RRRTDDVKATLKEIPESSSSSDSSSDNDGVESETSPEDDVERSSQLNAGDEAEEGPQPASADPPGGATGAVETFSGVESAQEVTKPKHGMCRFFLERGRCRHGDRCKYRHVRLTRQTRKKRNHKQLVDQLKTFLTEKAEDSESNSDAEEST
ncbi:hypothetical protein FOZ62_010925, partial [Perkinsus olseni]